MSIRLHHLENSRSQRIIWLLEELGLDYEIVHYARDPQTMLAPPELRALHPLGKSPLLEIDGRILAESGAVVEYLVDYHDPQRRLSVDFGHPDRWRLVYWLHYAEGSAMPPLLLSLVFSRVRNAPMAFLARPIARRIADKVEKAFIGPQLKLHFDYLESELASRPWFGGDDFGAADIQMSYPVEAAALRLGLGERPHLQAFLDRIRERPAYQRALAAGGGYRQMG